MVGDGQVQVGVPVRRQRRRGLALGGVLVGLASALVFATWASQLGDREPVVAVARDVNAGDVIERRDLTTVRVAAGDEVATMAGDDLEELVGKVATAPLFEGALVSRDQVSRSEPLPAGEAIVGVLLRPGQAPLAELRVGTIVRVVQTGGEGPVADDPPQVLADPARVFAISQPEGVDAGGMQGSRLVSLRVPEDAADPIVSAAAADRIRLVVVGGATS